RATQLLAAAGVAFYSTAFSSQALFSQAFRGYRPGCLRCRLPCRWRRIIGSRAAMTRGILQKIGIFRVLAGQASIYQTKKPCIRRAQAAFTLPWLFF
ncbi:hypothetical protein, partial [Aeromonas dhakensis]|uniref:hypothetical protein n=1 Tax=Aeromonas dhakensis TaxID=196024 RepID=UPI003986C38F